MASSRSEENVSLKHFQHLEVSQCHIFLWPGRSHVRNWQKLVYNQNFKFCFWESQLIYIKSNRMRNLHAKLISEYGQESVRNLRWWEKLEMKMADFQNHGRFSLRCLSKGVTPVSIKLKTTVKTPKGIYIVRKADIMLMNERIRSVNNMNTMFKWQIDTCINSFRSMIGMKVMEECHRFMSYTRERRHIKTLDRQIKKFNQLWQKNTGGCSNYQHGREGHDQVQDTRKTTANNTETNQVPNTDTTPAIPVTPRETRKWVYNLSKIPLTEDEEKVLAWGPNFAIVAKEPPVGKYISQIERMCQNLNQGKVEEFRGETKSVLKNI